jgi:putative membrane protein
MSDPGKEPDYRYTLANERTFLSWIRTALALIAGGIALRAFSEEFTNEWVPLVTAVIATVLGGALAVLGYRQWREVQVAMRTGATLPRQLAAPVLTAGVVLLAVALTLAIVL